MFAKKKVYAYENSNGDKEITVTKWNDNTKTFDKIFEGKGSHSINSTKGNPNLQADLLGDWREEIVSYAITGQDTKKEKTTIKFNICVRLSCVL